MTITIGNLFALRQKNMKRFLAFSSIAQAGFFLLGFIGWNQLGMTTVIYYALIYIFSNLAASAWFRLLLKRPKGEHG
jgi:NADH-quinone oxidoreductase subunit N